MSDLFNDDHRKLQDRFDSRRLADKLEQTTVFAEVRGRNKRFIESRDMFFLATVDRLGRPTVSYKGGAPGFVQVVDDKTLAFPSYDGNGMFLSTGNIAGQGSVGLLFIDFETPQRLRLQGTATVHLGDPLLERYPEADLMVRVTVEAVFANCPRYIHPHRKLAQSRYIPTVNRETPFPGWKRIDDMQGILPARDTGKTNAAGGQLTLFEYLDMLDAGDA
jgi:predicted pyridoxine 5'-phosphate oxidase superfamily flavin-nucleotide-binding protein